jgi:hypothetical protein
MSVAVFRGVSRTLSEPQEERKPFLDRAVPFKSHQLRGVLEKCRAVEVSKEVAARAHAGEVLLTNRVRDLVSGPGVAFSDRGTCNFEGLQENCQLFAAV